LSPQAFHFNCALCGAKPEPVALVEFLSRWRKCCNDDFDALLNVYWTVLRRVMESETRRSTKKFLVALDKISEWCLLNQIAGSEAVNLLKEDELFILYDCPFCLTRGGKRPKDNYFTVWENACAVQVANLLYEIGIAVFAALRELPAWATPERLGSIGDLLALNQRALMALGMLECPYCGRHTNGLYGDGSANNPRRCRWCLDEQGPMRMILAIEGDKSVSSELRGARPPLLMASTIVPRSTKLRKGWNKRPNQEGQEPYG